MLLVGPLPLQGALNHWGRYLPISTPGSYHLHTVCFWRGHSLCRAPLTTGVDIYPRVLPSAYCVLLAGPLPLQGALNHWGRYLPISTPGSYHLHTVCFWWGHSLCRAPLTTGVDIYPRVLPSAYCVLLAGPLPLQGALNHWGRYLPISTPGSYHLHTVCFWWGHSLCRAPLTTGVDIYPYLPQGPTICILCASGGATPFAGRP